MSAVIIAHLWESTLFAAIALALAALLRGNAARLRYAVWFAASMKFLLPFAWLAAAGASLGAFVSPPVQVPAINAVINVVAAPATPATSVSIAALTFAVWLMGCVIIVALWLRRYVAILRAAHSGERAAIDAPLPVAFVRGQMEPGVIGILRPVILLPAQLSTALTAAELRAIIAHELTHVRRRDNLTAALHMLVQALFWFHPLVWWIGAKLVEERERACDEAVLAAGNDAGTYAEAILKVCRFYVRSPLICAAGVSGADLKQRVEQIMMNRTALNLSFAKKLVLGTVVLGTLSVPLALGWASAPALEAPTKGLTPVQIAAMPEVSYDDLLKAAERGNVAKVMVVQANVTGTYTNGEVFRATAPVNLWNAPQSLDALRKNGVQIMMPPRSDPTRRNVPPAEFYPADARAAREEGSVVLLLTVDDTGDVVTANVEQSTGYERLDNAAVTAAVNSWRFIPGRVNGTPVEMEMKIKVSFEADTGKFAVTGNRPS